MMAREVLGQGDAGEKAQAQLLIGKAAHQLGQLEEALEALTEAKAAFYKMEVAAEVFEASLMLGRVQRDLGSFNKAEQQLADALEFARMLKDPVRESSVRNLQASVHDAQGDYGHALKDLESALYLVQDLHDWERRADILSNIGNLHTLLGNYPQALEKLKEAYDIYQDLESASRGAAINLLSLGQLYQELSSMEEATLFFDRAAEVGRQLHDPLIEASALNNLANLHLQAGDLPSAEKNFTKALSIAKKVGAQQYEIDNLDGLGQVFVTQQNFARAEETYIAALDIARNIGDREGEVDILTNLSHNYLAMAQPREAIEPLKKALMLANEMQRQKCIYQTNELLSQAYEQLGDFTQAFQHYRAFHQAKEAVFNVENEERISKLSVQFDVERTKHAATESELRTMIMKQARDEAEEAVRQRTQELEEAQLEIVTRLAVAAEYRDDDTGEHTRRVGRNAALIARALGWSEESTELLSVAARLHDVGKIGVSDSILHKPGKLDPDEVVLMRKHTSIGANILSTGHSPLLQLAEEIALAHHERWDGKGYPLGLSADAIPLSARIVAVADVLDALTHERPYKRAWTVNEALAEIRRQSGHHFDPQVVEACTRVFADNTGFSPLELPADWQEAFSRLQKLDPELQRPYLERNDVISLKQRFDTLLEEKARELEASRREADSVNRRLQEMAFTDPLTGLGNRRAFEEDLEAEVSRALRDGELLSVLTLDMDMLKVVNDTEGHDRGDALLRAFADAINHQLRSFGRVYRVGGDEFLALLKHVGTSDFTTAAGAVERAMATVCATGFPQASVSIGFAAFPEEVAMPGDLVRLSDQRMYRHKVKKRRLLATDRGELVSKSVN